MTYRHSIAFLFLATLITSYLFSESFCYFTPPKDWKPMDPEKLPFQVEMGFIGKSKEKLPPSINLSTESIDISQKSYLQLVKKIHTSERKTSLKDMGTLSTKAGVADLLQITRNTPAGKLNMLQAILVKDTTAYVLTAAGLEKEFFSLGPLFLEAIRSFTITTDLIKEISDPVSQKKLSFLKSKIESENTEEVWKQWEKCVKNEGKELGIYWQLLALKQAHKTKQTRKAQ